MALHTSLCVCSLDSNTICPLPHLVHTVWRLVSCLLLFAETHTVIYTITLYLTACVPASLRPCQVWPAWPDVTCEVLRCQVPWDPAPEMISADHQEPQSQAVPNIEKFILMPSELRFRFSWMIGHSRIASEINFTPSGMNGPNIYTQSRV